MLKHFLNLRKRLLFGQLAVLGLFGSMSLDARAIGALDQAFEAAALSDFNTQTPPAFDPDQYDALFKQQARVAALDFQTVTLSRGLNVAFARRLADLPPSELMALGFVANPDDIASDEVAQAHGIASPGKVQQFRSMLEALQAQWAKQGKSLALSEADMQKLLALLAQGKSIEGQSEIDPALLAAVQTSADNFGKASSDEERQQIVAQFNDSLGAIASHVGGDTGALLGSVHGAVTDSLASGEPIAAAGSVASSEDSSQNSDTTRAATEDVFKGLDLTDAPSFSEQYVNEDKLSDNGTKMASNGWLKPGDVDRLLSRQADDAGSGTRNFAGYRPQVKVEGAPSSDTTEAPTGGTTSDAKASAHEQNIKSRLDSITADMKQNRPSSSGHSGTTPASSSSGGTDVASNAPASNPNTSSNSGNTGAVSQSSSSNPTPTTPKPNATEVAAANSGLANLARIEAANLGITDQAKIDQFVSDYVKQNAVADTYTPVVINDSGAGSGSNGPSSLNAFKPGTNVASNGHSSVTAGGSGVGSGAGSICEVASHNAKLHNLTNQFITRYRIGVRLKPSEKDAAPKVSIINPIGTTAINETAPDAKFCKINYTSCGNIKESGASAAKSVTREEAEKQIPQGTASTLDIANLIDFKVSNALGVSKDEKAAVSKLADSLTSRLRELMQQKGFCPKSDDLEVLQSSGQLATFSDIYTQALYEAAGRHNVMPLDSKGCPSIQSTNGTKNTTNLSAFSDFITQASSQERDVQNVLKGKGQGPETWCSHGTLDEEPFSMQPITNTFLGGLKATCSVSMQMATQKIYRDWRITSESSKEPSLVEAKGGIEALRSACLTNKTAYLAMRALGFSRETKATQLKTTSGDETDGRVHE